MHKRNRKKNGPVGIVVGIGSALLVGGAGYLIYKTLWAPKEAPPVQPGAGGNGMPGIVSILTQGASAAQGFLNPKAPTGDRPCDFKTQFEDLQGGFDPWFGSPDANQKSAIYVLQRARNVMSEYCAKGYTLNSTQLNCLDRLRRLAAAKEAKPLLAEYPSGMSCIDTLAKNAGAGGKNADGTAGLGCWWCV